MGTRAAGGERVYLDHASTTPLHPEALDAMRPFLGDVFGNPSGGHLESRRARRALEDSRDRVAAHLGAEPGGIVFTGGGTEADNLAVFGGYAVGQAGSPSSAPAVVCAAMEHHAVLHSCRALARLAGAELREVGSDKEGIIDLDALADACTPDVGLVSVMTVNNEIGTIQPLDRVAALVRRRSPNALLHTDAVQAVPWLDVAEKTACADLVSVSAHKFGGPKGVGALVIRNDVPVRPAMFGGGQERERRSGTQNVAGIVGMGAALDVTVSHRPDSVARVTRLRDRLGDGLLATVSGGRETGLRASRVPGHLHLCVAGVEGEALVILLDEAGVAASAGAACSSGAVEPSHVLLSMGLGPDEASSGIRFSLGSSTTDDDVDRALAVVPGAVAQLRD
jgi:cysteine desulfurase